MGIEKFLKSGKIILNNLENKIEIINKPETINFCEISPSEWGQVYEKFVGQHLEEEGYKVQYDGLNLGFLDGGIDLIAENENHINFIQCKFFKNKIGKSQIDWILYKASNKLLKQYKSSDKKLIFTLVVNDVESNFAKKAKTKLKLTFTESLKIKYFWLQYFLDHKHIQDKVKLEFKEINMNNNYSQHSI
ncbi:MAG TPA: restriction endonuclease [Bacteroidales bacterium]|nr:restriction endonuclease [Bacteroidales bacterium]